jgi:stage II sporulation protein D
MTFKVLLFLIIPIASFGVSFKEFLYRKGIEFFNSGNYVGALEIFNYLGENYKLSKFYRKRLVSFFAEQPSLGGFDKEPQIRVKIGEFKQRVVIFTNGNGISIKAIPLGFKVFGKTLKSFELELKEPTKVLVDNTYFTLLGSLQLLKRNGRNLIVLVLPLEKYLLGVLPSEVYPSWNIEALKAQAVASRTFALYNILKRKKEAYDVDSGTNFQVFNFFVKVPKKVERAVKLTRGEILTYNGKPIYAMFHSNSGGETLSFKELFGLEIPYLSRVEDSYSLKASKWVSWKIRVSQERFKIFPFRVRDFEFTDRKRGRVRFLKLYTDEGIYKIPFTFTGRLLLKIPSDWCYKLGKNLVVGRGFGHGLGMSQWGAEVMAEEGKNYREILRFYYRGTRVEKVY